MGNEQSMNGTYNEPPGSMSDESSRKRGRERLRELEELYRQNKSDNPEKQQDLSPVQSTEKTASSQDVSREDVTTERKPSLSDCLAPDQRVSSSLPQVSDQDSTLVMASSGSGSGRPPTGRTSGTSSTWMRESGPDEESSEQSSINSSDDKTLVPSSNTESRPEVRPRSMSLPPASKNPLAVVSPSESSASSAQRPHFTAAGVDPDLTDPNKMSHQRPKSFSLGDIVNVPFQPRATSTPMRSQRMGENFSEERASEEPELGDATTLKAGPGSPAPAAGQDPLMAPRSSILKPEVGSSRVVKNFDELVEEPRKSSVHFDDTVQLSYFSSNESDEDLRTVISSNVETPSVSVQSVPLPMRYDPEMLVNQSEDLVRAILQHGPVSAADVRDVIHSAPALPPEIADGMAEYSAALSELSQLVNESPSGLVPSSASLDSDSSGASSAVSVHSVTTEDFFEMIVRDIVRDMVYRHFVEEPAGDATVNSENENVAVSHHIPPTPSKYLARNSCPVFPAIGEERSQSEGDRFLAQCVRQVQSCTIPGVTSQSTDPSSSLGMQDTGETTEGEEKVGAMEDTKQRQVKRGSIPGEVSPAGLLRRKQKKNVTDGLAKSSQSSGKSLLGSEEEMYPTPSQLHQKVLEHEAESQEMFPTPSQLHQKVLEHESKRQEMLPTPSQLHQKVVEHEAESQEMFPTPSQLHQKVLEHESKRQEMLPTPSQLHQKVVEHEAESQEMFPTPSQLHQKVVKHEAKSQEMYPTPSELLQKVLNREVSAVSPSVEQMSDRREKLLLAAQRHSLPAYSTASELLEKVVERSRNKTSAGPETAAQIKNTPTVQKKQCKKRVSIAPADSLLVYGKQLHRGSHRESQHMADDGKNKTSNMVSFQDQDAKLLNQEDAQSTSNPFTDSSSSMTGLPPAELEDAALALARQILAAATHMPQLNPNTADQPQHSNSNSSYASMAKDSSSGRFDSGWGSSAMVTDSSDYSSGSVEDVVGSETRSAPTCLMTQTSMHSPDLDHLSTDAEKLKKDLYRFFQQTPPGTLHPSFVPSSDIYPSSCRSGSQFTSGMSIPLVRGDSESQETGKDWSYEALTAEPSDSWTEMTDSLLPDNSSSWLPEDYEHHTQPIHADANGRHNPVSDHMDGPAAQPINMSYEKSKKVPSIASPQKGLSSPGVLTASQLYDDRSSIRRDTPVPWKPTRAPDMTEAEDSDVPPPSMIAFSDLQESLSESLRAVGPSATSTPRLPPPPRKPGLANQHTEHKQASQGGRPDAIISQSVNESRGPRSPQHQYYPLPSPISTNVPQEDILRGLNVASSPQQMAQPVALQVPSSSDRNQSAAPSRGLGVPVVPPGSTGASLPTSRVTSPTPEQYSGTSGTRRSSGALISSLRTQLVDKEVLESQIRRLQAENATLTTENKLLKDKYNRSQVRVQQLELDLSTTRDHAGHVHQELGTELSALNRAARDRSQRHLQDSETHLAALTREVERLRVENQSLESQLDATRHSADMVRLSTDRPRIITGFRMELTALKEEQAKLKKLLAQSEAACQLEADKRREASAQVIKLTEVKAMLQQELEQQGGGSTAHKQVKSLETRLHVTEDRLHQERADRAGKLSQVEDKLLNENARLQVSQKDLRRQLQRERDKLRTTDAKFVECREELERVRILLSQRPMEEHNYEGLHEGLNIKKHADEITHIMDEIKQEDNLGVGQEEEIIVLLWQRREQLTRQLTELELSLSSLRVDGGQISAGLKRLREERDLFEERIRQYQDSLEDLGEEKTQMEATVRGQIQDLLSEKHSLTAQLKTLDDMNAAISAENEALKASLRTVNGLPPAKTGGYATWEAQVESLRMDLQTARGEAQQYSRQRHLLEGEVSTLRAQLRAKEQSLEEALDELEKGSTRVTDSDLTDRKQHKIDKLNAEIKGLQAEVKLWQEKYHNVSLEVTVAEERVEGLAKQVSYSHHSAAPSMSRATESQKLELEEQLSEKDVQVMQMSVNYNTAENELQRTQKKLVLQQTHGEELRAQVEQLQTQLRQQSRALEQVTSSESQSRVGAEALQGTLAAVNRDLNDRENEVKKLQLCVEQEQWRVQRLTDDLHDRDRQLSDNLVQLMQEGRLNTALDVTASSTREALATAEAKVRILEFEKEGAISDIKQVKQTVESLVQENTQLVARVRETKQEVANERAQLCQLTAEKGELEQKCHILSAECESLRQEKQHATANLAHHQFDVKKVLQNLQAESLQHRQDLVTQYKHLDSEGKQMALELATARRLLEAREQEVILLTDLIERQKGEAETLCRKLAVVEEENSSNHWEMDRLATQLASKIKEAATSSETSQILASERSALSFEKYRMEHDRGKERSEAQRRISEITDLQKKMERTEEKHHHAEKSLHERETQLVATETELRHIKKNLVTMETERSQLRDQMNKLNQEMRSLASLNSSLETRLSVEKTVVSEEKSSRNQLRDDLSAATRQIEIVHREFEILRSSLEAERRNTQLLKAECQEQEDKAFRLEDRCRTMELEVQTLQSHLAENRNTIDQYKKDKQTLYQDVQELSRKLTDSDVLVSQLQGQCAHTVETIQKDFTTEKTYLDRERDRLIQDLNKSKDQLSDTNEKLRQKELQLEAYFRTNRELDVETKARQEAETHLGTMETALLDVKRQLSTLQADHARLNDQHMQAKLDKEQAHTSAATLREQSKTQREQFTREIQELKHSLTEEKHRHEVERVELQDQLNQAQANVKGLEASLVAIKETKESLFGSNKSFEKTVDELKSTIMEETTSRKLAEQRVESLKSQLEEVLHRRANIDEHTTELHATVARLESELASERDRHRKLQTDLSTARSSGDSHQARSITMETQLTDLQLEVTTLRSQLETHKQNLSGKNRRLALEMKQQMETFELERSKLVSQVQQLSSDLETSRNTLANKNKDNLQLTQDKLSLEENLRDTQAKLRLAQDAIKMEDELRVKMESKLRDMEMEISKQRARSGVDGDADTSKLEAARNEVNKMMAEVTRRMQDKLDASRDLDGRRDSNKMTEELKKRMASFESSLNHEQAMHLVTQTQLASVEEDNHRLRQQLSSARRRLANTGAEERTKSRIEEINEIIARSQTRAQAMLASGTYTEEALRCMSPPPGGMRCLSPTPLMTTCLSPIPFTLNMSTSPVNASMDDSPPGQSRTTRRT